MGLSNVSISGRYLPQPVSQIIGDYGGAHSSSDPAIPYRSRQEVKVRDDTPDSTASTISSTFVSPESHGYGRASSVSSIDSDGDGFLPLSQRQNSRRSSATTSIPPTLRRGDDTQKDFIEGLLVVTTSILEAIWPLSRETPRSSPDFNGGAVLPLRVFIQETCRRSRTSYSTLQIALYYLILLKGVLPNLDFTREQPKESDIADNIPKDPQVLWGQPSGPSGCRVMQCGRRMFMSALMLAAKYLQDRNFSVKAWSKISGLSCSEINKNEKAYLQSIEYRLHLKKEHFENWSQIVLAMCSSEKAKNGNPDYSKIVEELKPEIIQDSDKTDSFLGAFRKGTYFAPDPKGDFMTSDWREPVATYSRFHTTSQPSTSINCPGSRALGLALNANALARTEDRMPVANLYRCPPPCQFRSSTSTIPREQNISPPWSESTKSSSSSPDSTFSENPTPRSRSDSMSSTSSFRIDLKATPYPSPLGRTVTDPVQIFQCDLSTLRAPILLRNQPSHLSEAPTRHQPFGVFTHGASAGKPLPRGAATESPIILNKQRGEHGLGPAAAEDQMLATRKPSRRRGKDVTIRLSKPGHTSELVKAKRKLQREASRLVKAGHAFPDEVPDDSRQYGAHIPEEEKKRFSPSSFEDEGIELEDKEQHVNSKPWAEARVPVVTNYCNKRLAADLAAKTLRDEMKESRSVQRAR